MWVVLFSAETKTVISIGQKRKTKNPHAVVYSYHFRSLNVKTTAAPNLLDAKAPLHSPGLSGTTNVDRHYRQVKTCLNEIDTLPARGIGT